MTRKLKLALAASFLAGGLSLSAFSTAVACPGHDNKQAKAEEKAPEVTADATVAMFRVDGMHCAGCGDHVKEALAKAGGVLKVEVKQADKKIVVTFQKTKITAEQIAKLITEAGYPATAEV